MRRIFRIIVLPVVALLLVMASSVQPASASRISTITDTFNPTTPWSSWIAVPTSGSSSFYSHGRTDNYAWQVTLNDNGSWADVGRSVTFTVFRGERFSSCTASFWVDNDSSYPSSDYTGASSGEGQIEVINPSNWTYIVTKPFSLPALTSWTKVSTAAFVPPNNTFFVRLGAVTPNTRETHRFIIDDLSVTCTLTY